MRHTEERTYEYKRIHLEEDILELKEIRNNYISAILKNQDDINSLLLEIDMLKIDSKNLIAEHRSKAARVSNLKTFKTNISCKLYKTY